MRLLLPLILLLVFCSVSQGSRLNDEAEKKRAQEMLEQARATLGVKGVRSLSAEAKVRRLVKCVEVIAPNKIKEKEKIVTSKLMIDFQMPDKFRVREKGTRVTGADYDILAIMNGLSTWVHPVPRVPSSKENAAIVSAKDADQSFLRLIQNARTTLSHFTWGLLISSSDKWPYELRLAGTTNTDEGTVDVISLLDVDGYKSLLFLDPKTHLPTTLNETVLLSTPVPVIPTGWGFDRRYNRAIFQRAASERQMRSKPPELMSVQIRISDRRVVGGFILPFKLTTYYNGQKAEEIEFSHFSINEAIDPRKFVEKRPAAN